MATSQEIRQLCGTFLSQVRGVFIGLEKLPLALEELEKRESACEGKGLELERLDKAIAQKQAQLDRAETVVREKVAAEYQRLRSEMKTHLNELTGQIADGERRAAAAKETADQEEQRLRDMQGHIATLGLAPIERP